MITEPFIWLLILPLAGAPLIYLLGRLAQRRGLASGSNVAAWAALALLLGMWVPFTQAAMRLSAGLPAGVNVEAIPLRFDGLSLLLTAVVLVLGTLVTLFSGPYLRGETHEEKYYAMLLTMIGAIIGLACAADLFNLWVWFEAMAVSSYLLVVFYRDEPAALEAGVKYVVQSAVGSVFVLLGIALVLFQTGEMQLDRIAAAATASPALLGAGALFVIGFGVKTALVPMHTWLPDAHSQAPSGISAMLSGVVIEAGLIAMLRTLAPLTGAGAGYPAPTWGSLLVAAGAVNMLVGNLMALRQTQVKRLLAYSSLSHVGYMVFGLGVALVAGEAAGAQGSAFHLFNHGLMKGLAFLAAGTLMYVIARPQTRTGGHASLVAGIGDPGYSGDSGHNSHAPLLVSDLDGAAQRFPLAALAFSLAVLGLGGLPPLAGFMSKWQIFVAGFETHQFVLAALVVFAALNSVLSLAYYAPLVNAVYRKRVSPAVQSAGPAPWSMRLPLLLLAVGVIVLGLWPGLLEWLTAPAGRVIMAAFGG